MTPRFDSRGFFNELGARVRSTRELRGLTQDMLAHRAGYTAKTIGNIECGRNEPPLVTVFAIAEVLCVHPRKLLFGGEE